MSNIVNLNEAVDLSGVLATPVEEKAKALPKPSGYRILCAIPEIAKEYDSGLVKADETVHIEEVLTTVG